MDESNAVLLSRLNTWGCGGTCRRLLVPENADEAYALAADAMDAGSLLYVLGGGSNVLIQDGMLEAYVILTSKLNSTAYENAGIGAVRVQAGAGYPVKELLGLAFQKGWGGLEFLTGIPGSIGGALMGNAGAGGHSFGPFVESIDGIAADGALRRWEAGDLKWEYRKSPWAESPILITGATLVLPVCDQRNIIENIRHFSALKKGQPIGAKTAGCVFKNPPGSTAGSLLDSCGCKSLTVGGAKVSTCHANFIENYDNASSTDIFRLAELCRSKVWENYGIRLEYEIKFIGSFQTA